jgi:anti-sigma factor RsiW
MIRCRDAQQLIMRCVDGALNEEEVARLESHMAACAACRHELEAIQATMDALDQWESHQPMRGFGDLRELVLMSQQGTTSLCAQTYPSSRWLVAGFAALSLLVGVVAGVMTAPSTPDRPEVTEMAAIQAIDAGSFENLVDGSLAYSLAERTDEGGSK